MAFLLNVLYINLILYNDILLTLHSFFMHCFYAICADMFVTEDDKQFIKKDDLIFFKKTLPTQNEIASAVP